MELQVLQFLCRETSAMLKSIAMQSLKTYRWREPLHDAIFRCIRQIPKEQLRDELPSCMTRKGFPDFDFDFLFAAHSVSKEDFEKVIRNLLDS